MDKATPDRDWWLDLSGLRPARGQDYLLVVGHNGRGVFTLDGTRVARDPSEMDDGWHDALGLSALGIGPLDGVRVPQAGLWGGGLALMTHDGWSVARVPVDWSGERIILRAPYPDDEEIQVHDETFFEIRAVGFSPSGTALVIASTGEITLLTR